MLTKNSQISPYAAMVTMTCSRALAARILDICRYAYTHNGDNTDDGDDQDDDAMMMIINILHNTH